MLPLVDSAATTSDWTGSGLRSARSGLPSAWAPDSEGDSRAVVILNASDRDLPALPAIDGAMREAIRAGRRVPVELLAGALDMHRFPQTLIDQDLVALLSKKYRDLKVGVVVADATIMLDFAQRHGEDIRPGAAIVFNSVPTVALRECRLEPRMIGVPFRLDLGPTLDLALRLRPEAQRIAVVEGTADPDHKGLSLARALLERYAGRIDLQYLVGLSIPEAVDGVRALPADAVVLYLTAFRDAGGAPQVPRDVLTWIAAASPVPVVGVFWTYRRNVLRKFRVGLAKELMRMSASTNGE